MGKQVTVTKAFDFCYGHHLPGYDGKCCRVHGHNARLEVEVARCPGNHYPGMVMDFGDLKAVVNAILNDYDHRNLNELPPFVQDNRQTGEEKQTPTCENLAMVLFDRINERLGGGLVRLRLTETPTSWAEVTI